MRIGESVARRADRASRPGTARSSARVVPDADRGRGPARRRPSDPRLVGRRRAMPTRALVAQMHEFDDSELDPGFDEFGELADHVDGLALRLRGSLPRCGQDELGMDRD